MTLLTTVQQACYQLAIAPPATVISNTDTTALQLLYLANEEGRSLAKRHNWQALTTEKTFSTTAAAAQTGSIATDFDRMIPETLFNRTTMRRITGPISSDEWQQVQATVNVFINPVFRIQSNTIKIYPTPTAGQTAAYEYISKNWCQSSGGSGQAAWAADADTGVLDEFLMTLGIVWRFKFAHGMSADGDRQMYEHRIRDAIIRDGSRPRLTADAISGDRTPRAPQVPETWTGL